MIDDPYSYQVPLRKHQRFYCRYDETERLFQMANKGVCTSLIGPKYIGKTSLLLEINKPHIQMRHGLDAHDILFVYIDGQTLKRFSQLEILQYLLHKAVEHLENAPTNVPSVTSIQEFELTLQALVEPEQKLVYIIDEFETLSTNRNLGEDFFGFLRSLNTRYNISYITASEVSLLDLVDEQGQLISPFFNIFMPLYLGLFREHDARKFVQQTAQTADVTLTDEIIDYLIELAGPHPFCLQIACAYAFELGYIYSPSEIINQKKVAERVKHTLAPYFESAIDRLSDEERRLLALLLHTNTPNASLATLQKLQRKCLIRHIGKGYTLISQAFEDFLRGKLGNSWATATAEGERQLVTVLFADVVQFTPMSTRLQPEIVLQIIQRAQSIFVDVIDQYGGQVINFGGDSIMALFGVPARRPDDAIRAVRAALAILENTRTYAQELKINQGIDFAVRAGLDTGPVALGTIGGRQYSEHTAFGDSVNLASRLQSHENTKPGMVVISNHTYQQIRGHFVVKSMGSWRTKGKINPVRVYQVLEEKT